MAKEKVRQAVENKIALKKSKKQQGVSTDAMVHPHSGINDAGNNE